MQYEFRTLLSTIGTDRKSDKNVKMFLLSLEEAENERMHLMTALEMKQPGIIFRGTILFAQGNIHSFGMLS